MIDPHLFSQKKTKPIDEVLSSQTVKEDTHHSRRTSRQLVKQTEKNKSKRYSYIDANLKNSSHLKG